MAPCVYTPSQSPVACSATVESCKATVPVSRALDVLTALELVTDVSEWNA